MHFIILGGFHLQALELTRSLLAAFSIHFCMVLTGVKLIMQESVFVWRRSKLSPCVL